MKFYQLPDHYLFRIYTTYKRINRFMRLYRGPIFHAAGTAAYIPTGYFILLTIQLNLWVNTYLQFVSAILTASIFVSLSFYFEKRLKKLPALFRIEGNSERIASIFLVNIFIVLSYLLFFYLLFEKIEQNQ